MLAGNENWTALNISVFNLRGQRIFASRLEEKDFQNKEITINEIDLRASGIYILRVMATDRIGRRSTISKKFSVIK